MKHYVNFNRYIYYFNSTGNHVLETIDQAIDMLDQKKDFMKSLINECLATMQENQSSCATLTFPYVYTELKISDGIVCLSYTSGDTSIKVECCIYPLVFPYSNMNSKNAFAALINTLIYHRHYLVKSHPKK